MKVKEKKHSEFVGEVLSLNKRQKVKKPSRKEPTNLQISEFNLVKSITGKEGGIRVNDLTTVLRKRAKHVVVGKKVISTFKKSKTLPKPLEQPRAERIRRTVAFGNVKKQLNRWDAVVASHRAANHLSFPLPDTKLETAKTFTGFRLKSQLQKDLEELTPKVEVFNLEKESEYPLTMQEMMERRKEMAKMRAVQSYKEAKARRQSKIKSKKFHRVQRREKIKQQMKEFEHLQKTDPAEALKKLEEIERVRADERASLRHRSTGKWAKNKQVQAKYDKESRQELAQQLSLSRELTEKLKATGGDSESEEEELHDVQSPKNKENNPWTNPIKTSSEVTEFLSGYRKFWENENNKILDSTKDNIKDSILNSHVENNDLKINKKTEQEKTTENVEMLNLEDVNLESNHNNRKQMNQLQLTKDHKYKPEKNKKVNQLNKNSSPKESKTSNSLVGEKSIKTNKSEDAKQQNSKITPAPRVGTTGWDISVLSSDEDNIDDIFENVDDNLQKSLESKYKKLKLDIEKLSKSKQSKEKVKKQKPQNRTNKKIDLSLSTTAKRPVIDEQLIESSNNDSANKNNLAVLETILKNNSIEEEKSTKQIPTKNIDPNDIIKTKAVNLDTEIPDLLTLDDNDEDVDQKGTISEAFKDDDIIQEFKKDKKSEINSEKPNDINLTLPGWGSWGGTGIKPSKRKNKRFIMKFPKKFKRRDDNKGNLIINEKATTKIKPHLVSDVPFPFKKVKDFEASIRAPIGNTFVPETAYRRMIRPAVKTKMGTIIEPMTEDILLRKKK